jgi:hypothetical protein
MLKNQISSREYTARKYTAPRSFAIELQKVGDQSWDLAWTKESERDEYFELLVTIGLKTQQDAKEAQQRVEHERMQAGSQHRVQERDVSSENGVKKQTSLFEAIVEAEAVQPQETEAVAETGSVASESGAAQTHGSGDAPIIPSTYATAVTTEAVAAKNESSATVDQEGPVTSPTVKERKAAMQAAMKPTASSAPEQPSSDSTQSPRGRSTSLLSKLKLFDSVEEPIALENLDGANSVDIATSARSDSSANSEASAASTGSGETSIAETSGAGVSTAASHPPLRERRPSLMRMQYLESTEAANTKNAAKISAADDILSTGTSTLKERRAVMEAALKKATTGEDSIDRSPRVSPRGTPSNSGAFFADEAYASEAARPSPRPQHQQVSKTRAASIVHFFQHEGGFSQPLEDEFTVPCGPKKSRKRSVSPFCPSPIEDILTHSLLVLAPSPLSLPTCATDDKQNMSEFNEDSEPQEYSAENAGFSLDAAIEEAEAERIDENQSIEEAATGESNAYIALIESPAANIQSDVADTIEVSEEVLPTNEETVMSPSTAEREREEEIARHQTFVPFSPRSSAQRPLSSAIKQPPSTAVEVVIEPTAVKRSLRVLFNAEDDEVSAPVETDSSRSAEGMDSNEPALSLLATVDPASAVEAVAVSDSATAMESITAVKAPEPVPEPISHEEKVELLRKSKADARAAADKERQILLELDAERIANEEAQKQERWRLKEMARLQRQRERQEAEREAARIAAEIERKKREEEEARAREEEESYQELLRQMASRGLKVPSPTPPSDDHGKGKSADPAKSKGDKNAAGAALSKLLEKRMEQGPSSDPQKRSMSMPPLPPKPEALSPGRDLQAQPKPHVQVSNLGFMYEQGPGSASPFHFSDSGMDDTSGRETTSPVQQLSIAMMLQARFGANSTTPVLSGVTPPPPFGGKLPGFLMSDDADVQTPDRDSLNPNPVRPTFGKFHQSADSISSSILSPSAASNDDIENYEATPELPAYSPSPLLQRPDVQSGLSTELKLTVKDVKIPAPVLLRRLRLWALTEGFLFNNASGNTSGGSGNPHHSSVAYRSKLENEMKGCNVDVSAIEDWNQLVDALRAKERANSEPVVDESKKPIVLELEAQMFPRGLLSLSNTNANIVVKPMITATVSVNVNDSVEAIARKVIYWM